MKQRTVESSMRTRLPAAFCVVLGAATAAAIAAPVAGRQDLAARLDTHLDGLHESGEFNGVAMISVGDDALLAKGYGFANAELDVAAGPQTKFRIGSITKQFTAMGIMILQERGELSVADTLGAHLNGIPESWSGLTLHQLLTHTSGIMHSWALPGFARTMALPTTLNATLNRFHDQPLLFEPGTDYTYSGVGYFVLAKVIEVVSGQAYEDFLRAEIFVPLGMNDTGADRPGPIFESRASGYVMEDGVLRNAPKIFMPILTGGGNLYSTAGDLVRWDRGLREGKLISAAGYEALYTPELQDYAYGWIVRTRNGRQEIRHGGGVPGMSTHILRVPEAELCVVVLGNVQPVRAGQIAVQLADMVLGAR